MHVAIALALNTCYLCYATACCACQLQGKKTDAGYAVNNSKDFFVAKAKGDKSDRLSDAAAELNEAPAEKCQTFQREGSGTGKNTTKNKAKNFFASF